MATIERALNAHSLYWIKDETGDRIGIVWGLDGQWRWSVGSGESRAAHPTTTRERPSRRSSAPD